MADLPVILTQVRQEIADLDAKQAWTNMLSKDVPEVLTSYVTEKLKTDSLDEVRTSLGMKSPTDARWRKIMTAIRTGTRIDATGIFLRWMERNERLSDYIHKEVEKVVREEKPFSKMILECSRALSQLQLDTVKMGKELGVFTDPSDNKGGGQGVTIVVQTNVPSPSREVIVAHQEDQRQKAAALLDAHRPKEG